MEYIALHSTSQEVLFFCQFLDGLDMPILDTTPLYCDNDALRQLTEDQRWHSKIKHFWVHYHTMHKLMENDKLVILRICSSENVADILTKPLGPRDFACLQYYLGICPSCTAWGGVLSGFYYILYLYFFFIFPMHTYPHFRRSLIAFLSLLYLLSIYVLYACIPTVSRRSVAAYDSHTT